MFYNITEVNSILTTILEETYLVTLFLRSVEVVVFMGIESIDMDNVPKTVQ